MIAGLIRGNVEARPDLAGIIQEARGAISITARDVGATVGISFKSGVVEISNAPSSKADVEILADSEDLMAFSTVPLKYGLPDVMTAGGRALAKDIVTRKVVVRGMVRHLGLVRRLQRILTVT